MKIAAGYFGVVELDQQNPGKLVLCNDPVIQVVRTGEITIDEGEPPCERLEKLRKDAMARTLIDKAQAQAELWLTERIANGEIARGTTLIPFLEVR